VKKRLNKIHVKSDMSLTVSAYIFTIISVIIILLPLVYMTSTSLKDSFQVMELKPKIIPESGKSLSIVVDFSEFRKEDRGSLLDRMIKDSVVAMYSVIYQLNREGIFEVKFYGEVDDKIVYYSRAHKMQLESELYYGIYKKMYPLRKVLLSEDRYKKTIENIGYIFDIKGIDKNYDTEKLTKNSIDKTFGEYLNIKKCIEGKYLGTTLKSNIFLNFENFKYYMDLPKIYYENLEENLSYSRVSRFGFPVFLFNTAVVLSFAVIIQIFLCSLTAYSISRLFSKKIGNVILFICLGSLMIPFVSIMVPQFIIFKEQLGLYNKFGGILVPYLYPYGFYVYLFKGFFDRLPQELFDAARIDGAPEWHNYIRMCLPLSKPIISVIAINVFLGNWNEFLWPWLITDRRPDLWTLNVALYQLSKIDTIKQNFIMGIAAITMIPVIIITILLSGQIRRSISMSGIKG